MLRRFIAMGSLLFATGVAAEPSALSGDAIKETVAGAVFEVDTPLGYKVPVHYSEDGRLRGEARELAYILGSPSDSGRWWVASDRLCQKWIRWFDGAVHCLRLSQDGSRIFWRRDDGETGTASIVTPARAVAKAPARLDQVDQPRAREAPVADVSAPPSFASAAVIPRADELKTARAPDIPLTTPADTESIPNGRPAAKNGAAQLAKPTADARPANAPKVPRPVEPARAPPTQPAPSFRVAGVASHDVLNVRDGPSADYTITGAILPDAGGVRIVGQCLSAWCPISHRGITGWVNSIYLIEDTTVRGSEPPQRSAGKNYRQ